MVKKIVTLGIVACLLLSLAACTSGEDEIMSEKIQDGAYIATDNSGDCAIVKNNVITINIPASQASASSIICDTFEFTLTNGSYAGKNIRKYVSFKLIGDELTVKGAWPGKITDKETIFKKNSNIEFSSEDPLILNAPQDISINDAGLTWRFKELESKIEPVADLLYGSGILGAGIEVKKEGKDTFELVNIIDFYPNPYCKFDIHLPGLNLPQGTNIVKVMHLGGLFLQDDKISLSENSEAVYFRVTVNISGEFITEKI